MQFSRPQGVGTQSGTHQRHKMFIIILVFNLDVLFKATCRVVL